MKYSNENNATHHAEPDPCHSWHSEGIQSCSCALLMSTRGVLCLLKVPQCRIWGVEATTSLEPTVLVADIFVSAACYPEWAHVPEPNRQVRFGKAHGHSEVGGSTANWNYRELTTYCRLPRKLYGKAHSKDHLKVAPHSKLQTVDNETPCHIGFNVLKGHCHGEIGPRRAPQVPRPSKSPRLRNIPSTIVRSLF